MWDHDSPPAQLSGSFKLGIAGGFEHPLLRSIRFVQLLDTLDEAK
jgi:hypothetical protein